MTIRSDVPVPVFHPSILLDVFETPVAEVAPLDLELPEIHRSLARMGLAKSQEEFAPREKLRAGLIRASTFELHLPEMIGPRSYSDPREMLAIAKLLESETARDQQARP